MSALTCRSCGAKLWRWTEAFDKFGYDDGDGHVGTPEVVSVLESAGYRCEAHVWGLHNTVIVSITTADGHELIPEGTHVGYDNPRAYLPGEIIALLDRALPEFGEDLS